MVTLRETFFNLQRTTMKTKTSILFFFILLSMNTVLSQEVDSEELKEIYRTDQADRSVSDIDWTIVSVKDSIREDRVLQMLDSNLVITSNDYANAAMVFQHGGDSVAYRMVIDLMRKSIELDPNRSKWLLAAGIDRELMSRKEPQIYGTQFRKYTQEDGSWGAWELYKIDTTVITDEERIEYGVQTLAQQRERVISMNLPTLEDFMQDDGLSTKDIVNFCKKEIKKDPPSSYVSENTLNNFGYYLMQKGLDKDALRIFKLNTEFYPKAFNTFDSLGECYLKIGNERKGVKAYKKSLELNSENTVARRIISNYEK